MVKDSRNSLKLLQKQGEESPRFFQTTSKNTRDPEFLSNYFKNNTRNPHILVNYFKNKIRGSEILSNYFKDKTQGTSKILSNIS